MSRSREREGSRESEDIKKTVHTPTGVPHGFVG